MIKKFIKEDMKTFAHYTLKYSGGDPRVTFSDHFATICPESITSFEYENFRSQEDETILLDTSYVT
jgi:hypothetical protein